ncbi:unnamed protein product [Closterium sp. NIES-53]
MPLRPQSFKFSQPTYLSKKKYGMLQVAFQHVRDADFVWMRSIEHDYGKDKSIQLDWQHPENTTFKRERHLHPDAVAMVLKSVPAGYLLG